MYGTAHRQLRKGIARVREAYTFQRAYNRSSYEHCLVMHKDDADFPRACMPLRDRIGRPWQSRNKDTTAPEDVLNGVMDGWWRFIGDDKHQLVGSVDDEAGVRHKNRFVEGEEPVPSKDYSTEDPAPWEKNRLVRDEPQHVEQKATYAWDSAKLPGVSQGRCLLLSLLPPPSPSFGQRQAAGGESRPLPPPLPSPSPLLPPPSSLPPPP